MSELLGQLLGMHESDDLPQLTKPAFGYPGSKYRSLVHILPELPLRRGYGEPFGGTGAVLINRPRSKMEVFNDAWSGVTDFYRCLRDNRQRLIDRLELTLHSREEWVWCADTWENCTDPLERAARWYYALENSYGCKLDAWARATKSHGQFGGAFKKQLKSFPKIHFRLTNVQIENMDWRKVFNDYDADDMVWYIDPPYMGTTPYKNVKPFTLSDHYELIERVFRLKGFAAVSSYPNPIYEKQPWTRTIDWTLTNKLEGFAYGGETLSKVTEVLYIKE